jgi:two-component system, LytTR family, response regulator AlgR
VTPMLEAFSPLRVLLVDDEALARSRLRSLIEDCTEPAALVQAEAAQAVQAMAQLVLQPCDVVLMDIHMPGVNGLALTQQIRALPTPPAVIFVTAFTEHAVQAFELDAVDYLTKPVRMERLQLALHKARRYLQDQGRNSPLNATEEALIIHERSRTERVPLYQVVYFKAELKYITVRTTTRSYILDGSLNELEQKYGVQFLRIHRNALVARRAIRSLDRHYDPLEGEGWAVRLHGIEEHLTVSRRQLPSVREMVGRKN